MLLKGERCACLNMLKVFLVKRKQNSSFLHLCTCVFTCIYTIIELVLTTVFIKPLVHPGFWILGTLQGHPVTYTRIDLEEYVLYRKGKS